MIASNVNLDEGVIIHHPQLVNLYGCTIGAGSRIGTFVEIQKNAVVGKNCKISSHSFVCEGVTLEDGVFIGHGVMFTNDPHPRAVDPGRRTPDRRRLERRPHNGQARNASIGSNATILPGVDHRRRCDGRRRSGRNQDVPDFAIVAGVPAKIIGRIKDATEREPTVAVRRVK